MGRANKVDVGSRYRPFNASLTIDHDVTFRNFSDYPKLVESILCRLGPFALAAICVPPWIDARVALGREEVRID